MLNERKLTERELDKRAEAIQGLLSNKRTLVKKYGKDAEKVMYGIATKQAKSKVESMNKEKIKELIIQALSIDELSPQATFDQSNPTGGPTLDPITQKAGKSTGKSYINRPSGPAKFPENIEEGHGLDQDDLDYLKDRVQPGGPIRGRLKKIIDFIIKSNILQDKTKDLSKGKVDENLIKEFIGGETEKRISVLFDKLVPGSGNTDTVEGEIIRALNRLIYRWGNDGDLFWSGYGAETAGPAMEYLTDASDIPFEIREKFKAWENDNFGKDYDKGELIDLAQIALQHVEIKVKEDDLTKNEDDLFNYGQKYIDHVRDMEEEEDEYDDYYDDDDEFMNEGHMMPMDDLDVGHTDNEPHMLKKELARAGQMVQMLYRAVDKYDGQGEVDFPQWWQKKIIQANAMLDSAFDYIDGEEMVAKIDAMIDSADEIEVDIDVVNEVKVGDILTKDGKKGKVVKVMDDMANVDFGNGDVYGITFGRIKGSEIVNEEEVEKRLAVDKAVKSTLKDEGGAAGLDPLVKAVKKLGVSKDELKSMIKKIVGVAKHKHGDYISTPINEEIDGGRLFDYLNKEYIVDDHFLSDDSYIVKREPSGKDQYVIFDYDKDKDQFQIRQMGGYRIDRSEAMKAGMKETSRLARAGMDAYMVDGNYSPTPISIKGLKDVVDHVMGGLSREAAAQQDYYARRGPTSGTIDEKELSKSDEKALKKIEKALKGSSKAHKSQADKISKIVKEKLTKKSSVEDHVEDFKDSDAPQFKGKSLKKIKQMALASFLSKQNKKANESLYGSKYGYTDSELRGPEFEIGQKVTYLGHPGEITKVNKEMTGAITYNVSYDKGNGKTKASNIFNKGGEIKAV